MLRTLVCAALTALPLLVSAGEPLTLDAALAEAERASPDLAAARARLEEARAAVTAARARHLPQLGGRATYTRLSEEVTLQLPVGFTIRDTGSPTSGAGLPGSPTTLAAVPTAVVEATLQPRDQLAAQVELTQAILAPSLWYAIEAAGAGARAEGAVGEAVRREVRLGVAQAYYGAAAAEHVVAIQERQLAVARAHERDARVRVEAGVQPRVALLRAEIEAARVEQDLVRARSGALVARSALGALVGRPGAVADTLAPPPEPRLPQELASLEEEALRRRPELRAAAAGLDAARAGRRAITAQYAPSLGAFAQARWSDPSGLSGKRESWAAGVALSWNLFDGGGREAERRGASARVAGAEAALVSAGLRARDEVRRARHELASARANREKAERQVVLARENQRLAGVAFQAGQATSLETTDANAALAAAELAAVSEGLGADLAALRLLRAAGL